MPSRLLKEFWLTSERLDGLSADADRLFMRIYLIADDYGRFEAEPRILFGRCFPLKIGAWTLEDITLAYRELEGAGLVKTYPANGNTYGYIPEGPFPLWDQSCRAEESKFPAPPEEADDCRRERPAEERQGRRRAPAAPVPASENICTQVKTSARSCEHVHADASSRSQLRPYSDSDSKSKTNPDSESESKTESRSKADSGAGAGKTRARAKAPPRAVVEPAASARASPDACPGVDGRENGSLSGAGKRAPGGGVRESERAQGSRGLFESGQDRLAGRGGPVRSTVEAMVERLRDKAKARQLELQQAAALHGLMVAGVIARARAPAGRQRLCR